MFKSKKEKKENSSQSVSSVFTETSRTESQNSSTFLTRQYSSQSSYSKSIHETIQHSRSAGNVASLSSRFNQLKPLPDNIPLSTNKTPGGGLTTSLNSTLRSNFSTNNSRSSSIGRSSFPSYRTAFGSNTFGSYPSRSNPSPVATGLEQINDSNSRKYSSPALLSNNIDVIPTYSNNCTKIGNVLIINNIKFLTEEERSGAAKDSEDLEKLFKTMKFDVKSVKNLKSKEILSRIEKFSQSDFTNYDISVVVLMSHGTNIVLEGNKKVAVKGGYTEIVGVDGKTVTVDDLIEKFSNKKTHKSLVGKPKIFILQCCRGIVDQKVCHDAAPIKSPIKEYSDVLIAYSTLPGYLSNRNPIQGTWYIQSICNVFHKWHKNLHVEEMLKIVDDELGNIHPDYTQTSMYESRGFKRCYFFKRITA